MKFITGKTLARYLNVTPTRVREVLSKHEVRYEAETPKAAKRYYVMDLQTLTGNGVLPSNWAEALDQAIADALGQVTLTGEPNLAQAQQYVPGGMNYGDLDITPVQNLSLDDMKKLLVRQQVRKEEANADKLAFERAERTGELIRKEDVVRMISEIRQGVFNTAWETELATLQLMYPEATELRPRLVALHDTLVDRFNAVIAKVAE